MNERPSGIECADWRATEPPQGKRCAAFVSGGGCEHRADGVCVEWVRANPGRQAVRRAPPLAGRPLPIVSDAPPPAAKDPNAPPALSLVPSEPKPSAAQRAREMFQAQLGPKATATVEKPVAPFEPAKAIAEAQVRELEAACEEVTLDVPDIGRVHLVRERTPDCPADRVELTFREAATLRLMVDSFPGARVVGIKQPGEIPF